MRHTAGSRSATIGYYDDSAGAGGTTRYLMTLIQGLDRARFQPLFLAPRWRPWQRALVDLGVDVVTLDGRVSVNRGSAAPLPDPSERAAAAAEVPAVTRRLPLPRAVAWTAGHLGELLTLARLFRRVPLDLLHSNNAGAEIAPVAARCAGVPIVVATWHVLPEYDLDRIRQGFHYRALEHACMRSQDHAISVSAAAKRAWVRRCHLGDARAQRVTVIHNGVAVGELARRRSRTEARAAFGLPDDAIVVGSLGRLEPIKGYDVLIRALPELVQREPRLQVVIAGAGAQREELVSLARGLGVADRVHLVRFQRDVRDVLESMDIYVQPSRCEAHCLGLLEAGALGLPSVACSTGGNPETVVDGETGLLVPGEDAGALARALARLLDEPGLRERLGEAARGRIVREFSVDRMVARTMAVYGALLPATDR